MIAALEVSALVRRYGRHTAVRGVSFRVEEGATFGLLGPNGAGKTTTLACALGLSRPTSGSATVFGEPARRAWSVLGRLGCAFESAGVLPGLDARHQLEYVRRLSGLPSDGGDEARRLLELVGLGPHAKRRADRFSLGQRRRLALAGALVGSPRLLVLDEPLAGLDPQGVRAVLSLFAELAAGGTTLVLSSHRLHELEPLLTHAAVLLEGQLVACDRLDTLLSDRRSDLLLHARPRERVQSVLAEQGIETIEEEGTGEPAHLRLVGCGGRAAGLNRALIEAGCEVSRLAPEEGGLEAFFAHLAEGRA